MGKVFKYIVTIVSLSAGCAFAQNVDVLRQEVKPNGQVYDITITPQDAALKSAELFFVSKGNQTESLTVYLEGVQGAKASLNAVYLPNSGATQSTLNKKSGWWNLPLKRNSSNKSQKIISTLPAMAAAELPNFLSGGMCSFMSPAEINEMLSFFSMLYGRTVTKEEFCTGSISDPTGGSGGSGSSSPLPNGISATTLLHKDNCRSNKSKMLVKLSIDLSGVSPSLLSQGYTIKAGVQRELYSGDRASSIKPTSDGRFAPRPLILMATLGGCYMGSENIKVITWGRKGPKETGNIRVADCVFWQGHVLSRAPLGGLNGGKANYTIVAGDSAYNVCFSQTRTRQRANGY